MKRMMEPKSKKNPQKTRKAVTNTATQKKYKHKNKAKNQDESRTSIVAKILITFMIAILAFVLIIVSGTFNMTEILVEENKQLSEQQIISFSGLQTGTNLFAISKNNIKKKLKENSYINEVKIKRILPNKIKLIIKERELEYVLQLANSYVYMDRQGFVLEISNNKPDVPIIIGLRTDLSNIKANDRLQEDDLQKMNVVIKIMEAANNNQLQNLITKIDVSNEENYTIYLESENKIAYLGDGHELNTRFLYIKAILKEQEGKVGEIFVNMDLNSEYVYFRENI